MAGEDPRTAHASVADDRQPTSASPRHPREVAAASVVFRAVGLYPSSSALAFAWASEEVVSCPFSFSASARARLTPAPFLR